MNILAISQFFPYPPNNGGRMRAYQLLRGLSKWHSLYLIVFSQSPEDVDHVAHLKTFCRQVHVVSERPAGVPSLRGTLGLLSPVPRSYVASWSRDVAALVDRLARENAFEAGIAFGLRNGRYVLPHRQMARIVDDDNCDTAYIGRLADAAPAGLPKFRRRLTWVKSRLYESKLASEFDAALVVSEDDRRALAEIAPRLAARQAIHVVPNGADLALLDYRGPEVDPDRIISPGALTYSANYDAASFFFNDIFPLIKARRPGSHLVITGATDGVDASMFQGRSDVVLTGNVEDIRPEITASRLAVVPTRIGGGTRLKILEALALGVPVVATSLGAMGLGLHNGREVMIADTPAHFADHVCRLLDDDDLRASLVAKGREFVAGRYGWDSIAASLNEIVGSAVDSTKGAQICAIK
jgi:polysaccharide biosynthesis protein PslH